MATATERRFTSLRKRLDQLGYRQPLGIESLPLVEKLFGDLLHTTESLKSSKQQLGKQKEQKVSRPLASRCGQVTALVNLNPPTPVSPSWANKGIDEKPFSQGGALDTAPFDVCYLKSGL